MVSSMTCRNDSPVSSHRGFQVWWLAFFPLCFTIAWAVPVYTSGDKAGRLADLGAIGAFLFHGFGIITAFSGVVIDFHRSWGCVRYPLTLQWVTVGRLN